MASGENREGEEREEREREKERERERERRHRLEYLEKGRAGLSKTLNFDPDDPKVLCLCAMFSERCGEFSKVFFFFF